MDYYDPIFGRLLVAALQPPPPAPPPPLPYDPVFGQPLVPAPPPPPPPPPPPLPMVINSRPSFGTSGGTSLDTYVATNSAPGGAALYPGNSPTPLPGVDATPTNIYDTQIADFNDTIAQLTKKLKVLQTPVRSTGPEELRTQGTPDEIAQTQSDLNLARLQLSATNAAKAAYLATGSERQKQLDKDAADAKAEVDSFKIARSRFATDTTPTIEEGLNASGLLESGATPEALAQALKQSGEAKTADDLTKLTKAIMARYQPSLNLDQTTRANALTLAQQQQQNQIANLLKNLEFQAQAPARPDILAQLLGVGVGAAGTALLRSKTLTRTPGLTNYNQPYYSGFNTSLDLPRISAGSSSRGSLSGGRYGY